MGRFYKKRDVLCCYQIILGPILIWLHGPVLIITLSKKPTPLPPAPLCFAEGWVRNLVQVQSSPFTKDWSLFQIVMIPKTSINVRIFFLSQVGEVEMCSCWHWISLISRYAKYPQQSKNSSSSQANSTPRTRRQQDHGEFAEVCLKTRVTFLHVKKPYNKLLRFSSKKCETNQIWGHLIARHVHILSIGMV